eukprot:CAMPEP_0185689046 /NCGR_PEP_ID=MMETSP1164-20130828/218_1 /TAXON_ID=1104430 /ORGANISM="Chrysoreinhardia sp, Strain CCMP2950" /LENGTH=157 /DNA_ID=CAMNT_0028355523 /DNA_START=35 /DNA_END=505 /DNA_ORIENTATION=-
MTTPRSPTPVLSSRWPPRLSSLNARVRRAGSAVVVFTTSGGGGATTTMLLSVGEGRDRVGPVAHNDLEEEGRPPRPALRRRGARRGDVRDGVVLVGKRGGRARAVRVGGDGRGDVVVSAEEPAHAKVVFSLLRWGRRRSCPAAGGDGCRSASGTARA